MEAAKTVNLYHAYPDGTQALRGVNFNAEKGERVAVMGSNGAGKTTLFYCLSGICTPARGDVFIDGEKLEKSNLDKIRRKVGMVFQNPDDQLFAPTVYQDVAFGPRNLGISESEVNERVIEALRILDIYHLRDRQPHSLSSGQKRMVAIAGVLAMNSEILVLDEPLSNLDAQGVSDVISALNELNEERDITIIISSHSLDAIAEFVDNVFILNDGSVIKSGTPHEIFKDEEALRRAKINAPVTVRAFRDFEARGIAAKKEIPLNVLDLVDGVDSDVIVRYAIAEKDFPAGGKAGLVLKDGMIFAVSPSNPEATAFGRVLYPAKSGDDIALIALEGKIKPRYGEISVIKIPSIANGGSKIIDLEELRMKINAAKVARTAAMGTSAKVALKKLGLTCNYDVDVIQASISAALRGANVAILASGMMAEHAIKKIKENNQKNKREIKCELI